MSRTLTCPMPQNINPLSPTGYLFSVQKLPNLTYFSQEVNLPGISIGTAEFANPLVRVPMPGEMLEFEPLTVQFLVDSNMENYKAIYNWLNGMGFPENNLDYTRFIDQDKISISEMSLMTSNATLSILNNTNSVVSTISFEDCYPISLGSLQFTSSVDDVQYLIGNVTFNYTLYKFI